MTSAKSVAFNARWAGFLGLVFALSICRIVERDTPWYLRAGEEILRRRALPLFDPFSYTSDHAWLNHEWLSEVFLAAIYRAGGFLGLGILQGLLVMLPIALLLFVQARRMKIDPLAGWGMLVYGLAALLLREGASPRAQLFSNLLFAATLALALLDGIDPPERRRVDPLLWTIPIGLLWTQLHGGNPTGAVLLVLLFLTRPTLRRGIVALAAALMTCVGPYGPRVHSHFLEARSLLLNIREWHPLSDGLLRGSLPHIVFTLLVLGACGGLWVRAKRKENVRFEALALALFTLAAMRWVRFTTEATLVATVALAPALPIATPKRSVRLPSLIVMFGLALFLSSRRLGHGLEPSYFPVGAVEYLHRTRPPGPLFNSYNFGGYLLWAYPEERVFVDGRFYTVYSERHLWEFLAAYKDPSRFRQLEARHGFKLAVVQRAGLSAGLATWLLEQPDWQLLYQDKLAAIYGKR